MVHVLDFITKYWLGVLIAFILLIVVMSVFRAIFKLIALAVLIGLILIFGFNYTPKEVADLGKHSVTAMADLYNKEAKGLVNAEIKDAKVTQNADGTYTIRTKSVQIIGKKGTPDATIIVNGLKIVLPIKSLGENVQKVLNSASNGK